MNLVQIVRDGERRIALVDDDVLRMLDVYPTIYALAQDAIRQELDLVDAAERAIGTETTGYDAVYAGKSVWRLLPSFDHPQDAAHCLVAGTGLTHKASAANRAAMHAKDKTQLTDSERIYQMGLAGGAPPNGQIGVQPEWFYKGNGSMLRAHGEPLEIPAYAGDGGEEPEIAGAYLIAADGTPYRVGLTMANEFSDHIMERQNYLYLAPSKLRTCSIGPELAIGPVPFEDVTGSVSILRGANASTKIWSKTIWSGQKNMSHSLANLEHHHFKYAAHRVPGSTHIHFFGADAFSFGEGVRLEAGDTMEIAFEGFGRPLRNPLVFAPRPEQLVTVRAL